MALLLNIPFDVWYETLSEWLMLHQVCLVDTAYCNVKLRPVFLELLTKSYGLRMLHCLSVSFFNWINARKIPLKTLFLSGCETFLINCDLVVEIDYTNVGVADPSLSTICTSLVNSSKRLKRLSCMSSFIDIVDDSIMNKLAHLSIDDSISSTTIQKLKKSCFNLTSLELYDDDIYIKEITEILSQNQKLQSVAIVADIPLETVFQCCPNATSIHIMPAIASLLFVTKVLQSKPMIQLLVNHYFHYWADLNGKHLSVVDCPEGTNALHELLLSIDNLMEVNFRYIDEEVITAQTIDILLSKFSKSLQIVQVEDEPISTNFIKLILSGCHSLIELSFKNKDSQSMFTLFDQPMPSLKRLILSGEDIKLKIVLHILQLCPNLEYCTMFVAFSNDLAAIKEYLYSLPVEHNFSCALFSNGKPFSTLEFNNGIVYGKGIDQFLTQTEKSAYG